MKTGNDSQGNLETYTRVQGQISAKLREQSELFKVVKDWRVNESLPKEKEKMVCLDLANHIMV